MNQAGKLRSPEDEATRLVSNIIYAKTLESGQLSRPAQEPITIIEEERTYRYPSLQAFRADIKHRMDSLRQTGVAVDYDTLITKPIISGKLRTTHD